MSSNIEKYKEDLDKLVATGESMLNYSQLNPVQYETWYSMSFVLLQQVLPQRVNDFQKCYEYLTKMKFTLEGFAGHPRTSFQRQVGIIKSAREQFDSFLSDIKQDVFNFELDEAQELNNQGSYRGAGILAGVVLERYLKQICQNHSIIVKRKPSIKEFTQLLEDNGIIDDDELKRIKNLGTLRDNCAHPTKTEPTKEKVAELIAGVNKTIKTLF